MDEIQKRIDSIEAEIQKKKGEQKKLQEKKNLNNMIEYLKEHKDIFSEKSPTIAFTAVKDPNKGRQGEGPLTCITQVSVDTLIEIMQLVKEDIREDGNTGTD